VVAVPRLIKFSGEVRDARGEPLGSVPVRLTFAVYEAQTGGAALWAETQMAELDEQGRYSVLLGATRSDGLPVELFPAGKARWLGVQAEGRDEDPRVLLVSVPYALKAEDAAMLGGRRASDFVLSEQLKEEVRTQVEAQKPATSSVETLVNNPPSVPAITEGPSTFTCATTGDCVAVTQSGTGRALKATATSASEAALLQQNGTGYGLRVLSQSNYAIYGVVQGAVVGTTYGVRGQANSTTGAGVMGTNSATTGVAYGLAGQTSSVSGIGLYGRALATTGTTVGLTGDADSTSGKGIMGRATATSGTTMGIYAEARSAGGTALVVNNTASGKLVSGQANGVEKFSVDGSGNVTAAGTFSGNGSGLTSVNATTLGGLTAAAFQPVGVHGVKEFFESGIFIAPANITQLMVMDMWGAGGGGGPGADCQTGTESRGGGGGGAAYTRSVIAVIPGATYNIVVGAGGTAGGGDGGDSQIKDAGNNVLIFAGGGQGGAAGGVVGAGGVADPSASISHPGHDGDGSGSYGGPYNSTTEPPDVPGFALGSGGYGGCYWGAPGDTEPGGAGYVQLTW
jgi:hypothetical protein